MTFTRRDLLTGGAALAVVAVLPRHSLAQDASEDVEALLKESAAAMAALQSFRFELTTVSGTSTILDNLELKRVAGAVQRPESFAADVTATLAVVDLTVQVIGIGQRLWVTDPLDAEGRMFALDVADEAGPAGSLVALINPDRLFLTAVEVLENAEIAGEEKLDGVETTVVTGEFDAARIADLASPVAGDVQSELPAQLILERMPVTLWIDGDKRVVRLEVEGPITSSESADVVRAIDLYDFDATVEIEEPTNVIDVS